MRTFVDRCNAKTPGLHLSLVPESCLSEVIPSDLGGIMAIYKVDGPATTSGPLTDDSVAGSFSATTADWIGREAGAIKGSGSIWWYESARSPYP